MEAPVGTFWWPLSSKHTHRIFSFAFEWKDASGKRETSWYVLCSEVTCEFAPVMRLRQCNLGNLGMRKCLTMIHNTDFFTTDCIRLFSRLVSNSCLGPVSEVTTE